MSNFGAVGSVVHEQQFHVLLVANEELAEAIREEVTRLFCLLGTNLRFFLSASKSSAGEAINTTDGFPRSLQAKNNISELVYLLLDG